MTLYSVDTDIWSVRITRPRESHEEHFERGWSKNQTLSVRAATVAIAIGITLQRYPKATIVAVNHDGNRELLWEAE